MSAALTLALAPGLDLPIDAITEAMAILGKRGSGKTSTAVRLVEQIAGLGHPFVVIDPTGVWWGLRSSANGKGDGVPVVIFGGEHADVPLERNAGDLIARVIVERRIAAVLDLSALPKVGMRTFVAAFLATLYRLNREALHVVVDEADLFAPQQGRGGDTAVVLGAMEDLVRRGRAHGLGVTMITQRPAVLHKDVLSQAEVLIAMRMTGPRDVNAIDEWVQLHDVEDVARDVKASLPSLATGEAWVWSPSWLGILQRVKVSKRRTFDSSRTPRAGEARLVPQHISPVDLTALGEQIAATVEQAKADDPRTLRAQIAALERELASANTKVVKVAPIDQEALRKAVTERIQAAMADIRIDPVSMQQVNTEAAAVKRAVAAWAAGFGDLMRPLLDAVDALKVTAEPKTMAAIQRSADIKRIADVMQVPQRMLGESPGAEPRPEGEARPGSGSQSGGHRGRAHAQPFNLEAGVALSKAERTILEALAKQSRRLGTRQVAFLARYSHKSGGFRNALSSLRTAGYIEGRGDIKITEEGLAAFGDFEPIPTGGRALLEWWKIETPLGKAEQNILDVLYAADGAEVDKADIAEATGYSASSGGFRNAMSRLRSLELAYGRNGLALSETLLGP